MTIKYLRNFYIKRFGEIDFENIDSLNQYIDWLELNMTHDDPFLKPTSTTKCVMPVVVQQRELLLAFRDKLNESRVKDRIYKSDVDDFLDSQ